MLKNLLLLTLGLIIFAKHSIAHETEVAVASAFIPPAGFDDNDNVIVTVDGNLPNLCFELSRNEVVRSGQIIQIKQYATVRNIKDCKNDGAELPDYLNWPINYSSQISLGILNTGSYRVVYNTGNALFTRKFSIEKATDGESIDNAIYAPITNAFIPEMVYETTAGQVVLTGVLRSSCLELNDKDIQIHRFQDIIVVLPKLTLRDEKGCTSTEIPLQKVVNLGELSEGRYLLHIRATAGQSVSRVFTVLKRQADNRTGTGFSGAGYVE